MRAPLSTSDYAGDGARQGSGTEMHPRRRETARDTRAYRPLSRGFSQTCDQPLRIVGAPVIRHFSGFINC